MLRRSLNLKKIELKDYNNESYVTESKNKIKK
jgi:hypothetical protein